MPFLASLNSDHQFSLCSRCWFFFCNFWEWKLNDNWDINFVCTRDAHYISIISRLSTRPEFQIFRGVDSIVVQPNKAKSNCFMIWIVYFSVFSFRGTFFVSIAARIDFNPLWSLIRDFYENYGNKVVGVCEFPWFNHRERLSVEAKKRGVDKVTLRRSWFWQDLFHLLYVLWQQLYIIIALPNFTFTDDISDA